MFKKRLQIESGNSNRKKLIKPISPGLLVIDGFGLAKLTDKQASDYCDVVTGQCVIIGNRDVHERTAHSIMAPPWVAVPIMFTN